MAAASPMAAPMMRPVFAVGDAHTAHRLLPGRALLVSRIYCGTSWVPWEWLAKLRAIAADLTADSGAFTVWGRRQKHKCEACGERYAEPGSVCADCQKEGREPLTVESWAAFISGHAQTFDRFIALDVIGDADASIQQWERLLALVPVALHSKLVPVWHEGDPIEHLQHYDARKRLVALGRVAGRRPGAAGQKASRAFYDESFNAFPDAHYWALGSCNPELLERYPFEWFDATSWQRNAGYSERLGWPWCACSKETILRAYIEAIEAIRYVPRVLPKQTGFDWAEP